MVNAPLFAKTTTLAASSAVLAKPPARDTGWLRPAAAPQATTATDRLRWASACSQGLKPLAATQHQFTALRPPVRQPQQLLERHLHPISPRRTPSGHSLMPRLRSAQHKEENMNRPSRSVRPLAPLGLLAAAALAAGCSSGHAATAPPSPARHWPG
jgi:hypothetical protein